MTTTAVLLISALGLAMWVGLILLAATVNLAAPVAAIVAAVAFFITAAGLLRIYERITQ